MNNESSKTEHSLPQGLYAKHQKIYPRQVHGLFARLRTTGVLVLLGIYYGVPWLRWDDRQAVLFDLPARKFYIFGMTFWPQDFIYLVVLIIIAALSLFFFTALAGRLWCGYACPQTVWTEVFLWMERMIEGDRSKQMKLDKATWGRHKWLLKTAKQTLWILFSAFTGFVFVGYFTPVDVLWNGLLSLELGAWEWFWIVFYSLATYGNAGFLREQVCIYMCPYARFQGAMFDNNTLVISYDEARGEPKGSRKKDSDYKSKGLGDCINCTLCVQVCPTGIDIRDGLQYQCIGCAACIDVCDDVMEKMDYPKGLVRYTTENALHGSSTKIMRPRVIIYAVMLMSLLGGLIYAVANRTPLELDVIRDRNALYRETSEGLIENIYTLRIINMDNKPHTYRLSVAGIKGLNIIKTKATISLDASSVSNLPLRLRVDPVDIKQTSSPVHFTLEATDNPELKQTHTGRFIGPRLR